MASLATTAEREAILADLHPLFREVDAAFHAYLGAFTADPNRGEGTLADDLVRRGVGAALAEECVVFGPVAWGRAVAEQMGVAVSPVVRVMSLLDGGEWDAPLTHEIVYAWARAMIPLYRTAERNDVFKLVAGSSAELGAIDAALNDSPDPAAALRGASLGPTLVHLTRRTPAGEVP